MSSSLRDSFGQLITLFDEHHRETTFRLLEEIHHDGQRFAILQDQDMKQTGEIEVMLALQNDLGEWELETVVDDELWDQISEKYDDLIFDRTLEK